MPCIPTHGLVGHARGCCYDFQAHVDNFSCCYSCGWGTNPSPISDAPWGIKPRGYGLGVTPCLAKRSDCAQCMGGHPAFDVFYALPIGFSMLRFMCRLQTVPPLMTPGPSHLVPPSRCHVFQILHPETTYPKIEFGEARFAKANMCES